MPSQEFEPLTKRHRRDCAFCGSKGPMTKEDAWPRWLNKHLPPSPPGTALDLTLRRNEVVRESRRTVTSYNTARVAGFCQRCNNGWMSRLERRAAPLLLPLLEGQRWTLGRDEQGVVAEWVTKTALVFDQRALGRRPLVSDSITHEFGSTRLPIAGSRVLLAHYRGTDWLLNHAVSGLPAIDADGTERIVAAIVTLCLGQLVMQLICPTDPTEKETTSILTRDDRRFAVQLYPGEASAVHWPPEIGLNSANWLEFGFTEATSVDVSEILGRIEPPEPYP